MGMPGSKPGRGRSKSRARAQPATPAEKAERLDLISDMMRRLTWERGRTAAMLAAEWGLAVATVEDMAAEAWRRVSADVKDPEVLRDDIAVHLKARLADARYAKDAATLADVLTKIQGARAPEKVEHTHRFEGMPPEAMLARVDEAIAKLQEYREQLAAEVAAKGSAG